MADETGDNERTLFRKPNSSLWTATLLVIIYAVWSVMLLILAASGHLSNSLSFECGKSNEEFLASRLKDDARLVYLWSGLSLPICILLLLEFWRKKGFYTKVLLGVTSILFVFMCLSFNHFRKKEAQGLEEFEKMVEWRYLALLPLTDTPRNTQNQLNDTTCHMLNNVYCWQAEFKCCGVQSYQDWKSSFPDSCLCDGEDNSSGCVGVGDSFVHEKSCLPTVLSLLEKRRSTFWAIMIVWITITGAPVAICMLYMVGFVFMWCYIIISKIYCYSLCVCICKMHGREEMVPVVFIRKNNNNQTEEENRKDGEAKDGVVLDVEGGTNAEEGGQEAADEDWNDNPVRLIPLSELKRLQEELDPPPVQHQVRCMCISPSKPRNFYTILLEEGSPLLPSGAVLVDANKPTTICLWAEGHHVFDVNRFVWPRERNPTATPPSVFAGVCQIQGIV